MARYVLDAPATQELYADIRQLLTHALPRYEKEGKSYLTIALGCTGGRHRSVATAEALGAELRTLGRETWVVHRDVERVKG